MLTAAVAMAALWGGAGCDALCNDDGCPNGQPLEGAPQDLDTALGRSAGANEPARLPGAMLTGPTTCGTTTWVEVTGTGLARFAADGNPPTPRLDAGPPDPGGATPPSVDRATWIRTHLSPLVAGAAPHIDLGVFSIGFGLLLLDNCPSASGPTVYVETFRWPAVAPVAEHVAAALAAEDLGETVRIRISDEVVSCAQKACGY